MQGNWNNTNGEGKSHIAIWRLAEALTTLTEKVRPCAQCFNLTEEETCAICRDVRRDPALICVVEESADIGAIERAGEFRGVYHVLGGRLSPLDGVGPDDLTIPQLERWPGPHRPLNPPLMLLYLFLNYIL